jgi:hypothetical protein
MSANLQRRRGVHDVEVAATSPMATDMNDGVVTTSPRTNRGRRKRRTHNVFVSSSLVAKCILIPALLCVVLAFCSWRMRLAVSGQDEEKLVPIHLPTPDVDIAVPNATEWPLIHIVNTRFMQEQGALETLGMARLHLFFTFCFPTMINQSSQNFFWIIKTDPKFTTTDVFSKLVQVVKDFPNIYIVASNENFLIQPGKLGSWRDGAEGMDLLRSKIYTGNITELHQAIALRNERPILETRLDADDGLHIYYIQYIQWAAVKRFKIPVGLEGDEEEEEDEEEGTKVAEKAIIESLAPPKWLYWCTRRHLEWHSSLNQTDSDPNMDLSVGVLNPVEHSKLCVTPGITVGYNVGVDAKDVPVYSHDVLLTKVASSKACYNQENGDYSSAPGCLDLVEQLLFCALRSRTWTSAGMRNVPLDARNLPGEELTDKLWELLERRFTIDPMRTMVTQSYLIEHRKQIAYENLLGQCTSGHSCKEQAKEELKRYVSEGN